MADKLRDWLVENFPSGASESPIEALLYAGWELMLPKLMLVPEAKVKLEQQVSMGSYRADFLLRINDLEGNTKKLVVEVDGHDFHEKTKQQAAHDKARDRWMTANGYQLMRFTGSEVWANPLACAKEIGERLYVMRYGTTRKRAIAQAGFERIRAILEAD
jgi:very-short-patch-repair endonuclease